MKFEKKLVIMVGKADAKGTASLERNGYGTFATVSVYNLPDLKNGEYFFGLKTSAGVCTRSLGSLGKGSLRFKIEDVNLDDCHAFVFDSKQLSLIMYGTTASKKLWEGNLLDGIRRADFEEKQTTNNIENASADNALPNYSPRPQKIDGANSLFWNIVPPAGGYSDESIAEVNYYPSNLTFSKPQNQQVAATVNAAVKTDSVKPAIAARVLPSDMERQYLFRYRNGANNSSVNSAAVLQTNFSQNGEQNADNANKTSQNTEQNANKTSQNADNTKQTSQNSSKNTSFTNPNTSFTNQNTDFAKPTAEPQPIKNDEEKVIPPPSSFTAQDAVKKTHTKIRFYERAAKQIDELFKKNPRYIELEKLMPSTKWVRVEYNNSGKFYVVGLIGSTPDYLCYGVPAMFSPTPPAQLDGYSAFLPLDPTKPQASGFWLMYQDATTGESVRQR